MKYRLSDISTIISGGTPKKKVKEYWNGSIPWITIKDFNAKKTNSFTNYISEKGLNNSSANLTKENDILISSRGTVGKLLMVKSGMAFNQSIYDIRTDTKKVNSDYLYYWLYKNIEEIKQKVHGSVFDTITRETFDLIEIALPDLSVQSEISSKIKVIDEKIEANQQINDNLVV
ncbi:type I restriction-modification system specificity protein [Liquorilactobacillus ghanensis DSM 18630]|uniref:Type I restriction-modification system specificity protein n=1 Tax=Liquorilactobacillus ghanensis DSM 18630 TaxID=1423750 RepID=A0A0R1VHC6_9LACO|nr:restriction endonuclease subunit S [Liquorilactobacillus ghanensis]KRM04865.1 type I restriction-modification system specificity protein [Liquorilactobacillus ghanensis DSM 18630]